VRWVPENTPLRFKNIHRSILSILQLPTTSSTSQFALTDVNGKCRVTVSATGDASTFLCLPTAAFPNLELNVPLV